jgi:hypothetical protein
MRPVGRPSHKPVVWYLGFLYLGDFSAELAQIANGVLGPSQWEPGMTFPEHRRADFSMVSGSFSKAVRPGARLRRRRKFCRRIGFDRTHSEGHYP